MEYDAEKRKIITDREIGELDKFVMEFLQILEEYTDYVIISGYVSILLGRPRTTDDIDVFIKPINKGIFLKLYNELKRSGFWCLNAEDGNEIFDYLKDGYSIRFARTNYGTPNFEVKFPKDALDEETFDNFLTVIHPKFKIKISSLERQIAFKRYYLSSDKDIEDALFIEKLFKGQIDYNKVNKFEELIKNRKNAKNKKNFHETWENK
ncbi:MAG: hypothetical protein AABY03_02195 [Nanoarchaeota archaeon]